ncbi:hypothetical protein WME75_00295 [Sorangium sp. So ce1014]|uniref:hypothetical protein n=1 Tax=Sorangium sp. So ce1014 TaxID=3133326 RepID=UPI003F6019C4
MRAAIVALVASSALFLAAPALGARGVPCGFYGIDPGAPVEEGEVILDDELAEQLARAGAGAVRVELRLDDAEAWDQDKLDEVDAVIDAVIDAGLEPLGLLSHRTIGGGQEHWNDDRDGDGNNAYVEAFADRAEAFMTRYAGRVERWEIWSQPNCFENPDYALDPVNAGCTYILPRVLAQILAQIRIRNEALFNVDELSLITGGLLASDDATVPFSGVDYLRELYDQPVWDELALRYGERTPWSHLGHQLFVDQFREVDPVVLGDYLDEVRAIAEQEGDESPFFVTGMAWSTTLVGEELQAANLTTSLDLLSKRRDIAGAVWASFQDEPLDDRRYGLTDESGVAKLALAALREGAAGCEPEQDEGTGTGGSGGGNGSSSGGTIGAPLPGSSDKGGRPIDGTRRASACSYVAGVPRDRGALPEVGWLALLAASAIAIARSRRVI